MLARLRTRGAAPVTSQCTRYVAIHPIRKGVMPTDRVHRLPQQAQLRTVALRSHTPGLFHEGHARGTAPVPSRCTRSVAPHPIRRATPDQKGCNAYGSGAPPPTTNPTAGNSAPQTPTVRIGRRHTASTCSPRLRTRDAAPVTSRYTRYVALHPLRSDAPDQKGCNAYGSGALPPTTSTTAGNYSPQTPTVRIGRSHTSSKREAIQLSGD